MKFEPRGEVKFPRSEWKVGARVRMIGTGATGTISYVVPRGQKVGYGVRVLWDNGHEGRVVAAAFDLEAIKVNLGPGRVESHRISWFVFSAGQKLRHEATMRGRWDGWDASCSCGWESRTGGAIKARVAESVDSHKWDVANGFWKDGKETYK